MGTRVLLHHGTNGPQFLRGLGIVDGSDEGETLGQGKIGPVDTLGSVAVVGAEEVGKDLSLVLGVVFEGVRGMVVARLGTVGEGEDAGVDGIVVLVAVEEVSHGVERSKRGLRRR